MPPTAQSETGPLLLVALTHLREAWCDQATVDAHWRSLHYLDRPDYTRAVEEYDRLVELLVDGGAEPLFVQPGETTGLDAIYVRDASVVTDRGVILCRMGKAARRREPQAQREAFTAAGVPILGAITGGGTLEGGDVVWLDEQTAAVGHGYRTNAEGIRQLRTLLPEPVEVVVVPLPHFRGPNDVFHLMSILSPIDRDLALVYSPLMPVPFRRLLLERCIQLVEVPDAELDSLGGNCLAIAPRRCILPAGNAVTRGRLEAAGAEVMEIEATEICRKGCGGPTCLTRPVWRRSD